MTLAAGDRLGPYEISGPLGSGGMGDVYRAHDPRLGREVAIKVLPREVGDNADRLRRFEQEARALATLSHPNILAVHDVGVEGGVPYLVTELLDGETLRAKLQGGSLSVRRALDIAIPIATGLAAAHANQVVHRDLKPENVIVRRDGHVKLIDFGLAALQSSGPSAANAGLSVAATETRGTEPGTVLGTVGYMAPEQVRGQPVDPRADIFAFGAVLYELLTGRRAFDGATPADTMSAILHAEVAVPASAMSSAPPMLEQVVLRCLEKDPAARFQSTADLVFALKAATGSSTSGQTTATTAVSSSRRLSWLWPAVTAASLLAAVAAYVMRSPLSTPAKPPVVTFDLALPEGMRWSNAPGFAASPDNTRVALKAFTPSGEPIVLIRALNEPVFRTLKTTAVPGPEWLAWSPDSRYLAFSAGQSLVKVDAVSGLVAELAKLPCTLGAAARMAWHATAGLVFACNTQSGLYQVSPPDSTARVLTTARVNDHDRFHMWPSILPDGRGVLFTRGMPNEQENVAVVRLVSSEERVVGPAQSAYASGFLVMPRGDALYAQPFDHATLTAQGQPQPLGVPIFTANRVPQFSVNDAGTLLTMSSLPAARSQFVWFDRQGRRGSTVGPESNYGGFDITASGDRVVASAGSLWLLDAKRDAPLRLTFGDLRDTDPNVTASGRVFFSRRFGPSPGLYEVSLDGGSERQLRDETVFALDDVTDDGQALVYRKSGTAIEEWASPVASQADEIAVSPGAVLDQVHISPDHGWVAYNSAADTGRQEVYVVPRPATGAKWLISTGGGAQPVWRADGRELFYLGMDGILYAVAIEADGDAFKAGSPRALFKAPGRGVPSATVDEYRATADGQRFLFRVPVGEDVQPSLRVILNWPGLLDRAEPATDDRISR